MDWGCMGGGQAGEFISVFPQHAYALGAEVACVNLSLDFIEAGPADFLPPLQRLLKAIIEI